MLHMSSSRKWSAIITNDSRGKRGPDANIEISQITTKEYSRKLAPQILTDARQKACECIRTSYIWGCLLLAYSCHLPAENEKNADATTIVVGESLSGSLVCAILDKTEKTPVASSTIPDNLNILVKWFGLNNAGAEFGPLVLVFAVPSMTEGTYFSAEISAVASTSFISETGGIFLSKIRGDTPDMWKEYHLQVTLPTIRRSNAFSCHKVRFAIVVSFLFNFTCTLISLTP